MADIKRITKKEWYAETRKIVEASDVENKDDILEFLDNQVKLLEEKAEKAKENAAKKKIEGDALREAVFDVLVADEFQSIDDITAQVVIEGVEVTKGRVTARLTQLVSAGRAEKDTIKTSDGRKVSAYRILTTETEVETENN